MKRSVALVTGVSGGIGIAIARRFHRDGWFVAGTDVRPLGGCVEVDRFVRADLVSDEGISEILTVLQSLDADRAALINNAALQVCATVQDTTPEEWDAVLSVNLTAPFRLTRGAVSWLAASSDAAIVNSCSVHARCTSRSMAAYAATKAGLEGLTRASAIDLADLGIRVNAVLPGAVHTNMLREGLRRGQLPEADALRRLEESHLFGRIVEADQVAETVLFLADGRRSGAITGQSIVVDGGATIRLSTEV